MYYYFKKKLSNTIKRGQLDLGLDRHHEKDRNHRLGGRSFYFFDFDDNVASLSTKIYIFHKKTRQQLALSSVEYYQVKPLLGQPGPYEDFELDYDQDNGSYRNFRDFDYNFLQRLTGKKESFVQDLEAALKEIDLHWKAPSWDFFYYATYNQRPISIITARGHRPETIKKGIDSFIKHGHLPWRPNYLGVFPVSNPDIREQLGDPNMSLEIPELKKRAIKESVYAAINKYGEQFPHRFGMSDDDPKNIQLITEAMHDLKKDFKHMSFFVIDTNDGKLIKREVVHSFQGQGNSQSSRSQKSQLNLFQGEA